MDAKDLSSVIDRVEAGSRLKLTFKRGQGRRQAIDADMKATLSFFGLMVDHNIKIYDEMERMMILIVVQSGYWDRDSNRTFTVVIPAAFDREWFERRLGNSLEKVEIVT